MKDSKRLSKPGVNYYSLLGVPSTATPEDIKKAYRKAILKVHLDKLSSEDDTELCYLTIEAHRILSDKALRAKYDIERTASKNYKEEREEFIPAGYICYDVGNQQMSRQLLESITKWTKEYDQCPDGLCDNYFPCFTQIMEHIGSDDYNNLQQKEALYYCNVCDKKFTTEAHHVDVVIKPYKAMFFSDQKGVPALKSYFESIMGAKIFNVEKRYLPSQLLGIWESPPEWEKLVKLVKAQIQTLLKECDFYSLNELQEENTASSDDSPPHLSSFLESTFVEKLQVHLESTLTNNSHNKNGNNIKTLLVENLVWITENQSGRSCDADKVSMKMSDFLMQDDIQGIICLGVGMKYIFGFQFSDWEELGQAALSRGEFEVAMIWTMLAVRCGDKCRDDWLHVGLAIRENGDNVLAHFCFLLAGYDTSEKWEELADVFTHNGDHNAAVDYHLISGSVFQLFSKSKELENVDSEASRMYKEIFTVVRIKNLLYNLQKNNCNEALNKKSLEDIEELFEIIRELKGDVLQALRIFVSTWPSILEEKMGLVFHQATIQYLKKGAINLKSQKLILAGTHFLPEKEMQLEIEKLAQESSKLTKQLLEMAQESNDFELLTDVLINLNKRTLPIAEAFLQEILQLSSALLETKSGVEDSEINQNENAQQCNNNNTSPPAPPGYKSAIQFLIAGSIHKVKEAWLDAMCSFQNALLSAPEVMHRVLPCVSKLVQDIQFHEAVVSQVSNEIQDLQVCLRKKKYPDIDEFSSDKRRSLILTDTLPKTDYGYKDSFAKMQPNNPDQMNVPPPPDEELPEQPPPPANTPMVTLDKNQEAIQSGQQDGQINQLNAALAYVDLLKALPIQMHPGPLVMAASHFLHAMDDKNEPVELGKLYAYRNAIMMMAENLLKVDSKLQHTIHHGLTHKHMLSILLCAHEKLSKALKLSKDELDLEYALVSLFKIPNDSSDSDINKASSNHEDDDENCGDDEDEEKILINNKNFGSKKDLINKSEAYVIARFFQNVVKFPKIEPLASIPSLNCSDLVYVEAMGNSFLSQFCADKVRQKHQSPLIPKHLHAYTHFIEVWKGRSTLSDFPQARLKAMEELVALKGWTMGDIQRNMMCPLITLQDDGFSPSLQCLLKLRDPMKSYRTIEGFHIDYTNGRVELLFGRERLNPADTLFDLHDVRDVVSLVNAGLSRMIFSLETPCEGGLSSHPFKQAKVSICSGQHLDNFTSQLQNQGNNSTWSKIPPYIQATLSRVSMLLAYFASGFELCSETPFWMRNTCEGLLSRLDDHLQHFARPIPWRRSEQQNKQHSALENDTLGKFWLNMIEVFEEIEEEEGDDDLDSILPSRKLTYHVGEIRSEIRPNTLVMTLNPKQNQQSLNPEGDFAKDFTKNFRDFSRHFPELQRLEELVKICIVCEKLKQVLLEGKSLIREFNLKNRRRKQQRDSNPSSLESINCVSRVCSVIENFLTLQQQPDKKTETDKSLNKDCDWFPAIFCHNLSPDVYDVTVGIELDPVVTYGPVPSHRNPIRVSLNSITNYNNQEEEEEEEEEESNSESEAEKESSNESSTEKDDDTDCKLEDIESEEEEEEAEISADENDDENEESSLLESDNVKSNDARLLTPCIEEEDDVDSNSIEIEDAVKVELNELETVENNNNEIKICIGAVTLKDELLNVNNEKSCTRPTENETECAVIDKESGLVKSEPILNGNCSEEESFEEEEESEYEEEDEEKEESSEDDKEQIK